MSSFPPSAYYRLAAQRPGKLPEDYFTSIDFLPGFVKTMTLNTSKSQFKKVYQIPSLQRKMEDNF